MTKVLNLQKNGLTMFKKAFMILFVNLVLFNQPVIAQEPLEITVTTLDPSKVEDGFIFLSKTIGSPGYIAIIDLDGNAVYEKYSPKNTLDFKMQPDGTLTYFDADCVCHVIMNSNFTIIDTIQAGNGFITDGHDFNRLANGNYLVMIYDEIQPFDLSAFGGHATATLISTMLQEIDPSDDSVVRQWRDLDHIPLTHTNRSLTTSVVDYAHGNSAIETPDGKWLLSTRGTDEIHKIDPETGNIIWTFGGIDNDWITDDPVPIARGHDARILPTGKLSFYDNGDPIRNYSRGVVYQLNENTLMATKTFEYSRTFSLCCGNIQRLDENWIVNGPTQVFPNEEGLIEQVTPEGEVVWRGVISGSFSYRAFLFQGEFRQQYLPVVWK